MPNSTGWIPRPILGWQARATRVRVFLSGATGAIGARLVPQLLQRGHEVIGTSRSQEQAGRLRAEGAEPVGREAAPSRPALLARLAAGEAGVVLMTEVRGASNAKAKRELGWTLRHPSWRQGFHDVYSERPRDASR